MIRILIALIATLALFTTTARADDGWDCKKPLEYINGSSDIGWTVICDEAVWLCPAEADDDDDILQSECREAVPSKPTVATAQPSPPSEDIAAPEPRVETRDGRLTITNTPAAPQPSSFGGGMGWGSVTAPELMDPPLRAYTYKPAGCETSRGSCVEVPVINGTAWVVRGPEGIIQVMDRYGRPVSVVTIDMDSDGRLSPVEMAGIPTTFPGNTVFYLKKDPAVSMRIVFEKVEPDSGRFGYWRKAASGLRNRSVIPGQDCLDTLH